MGPKKGLPWGTGEEEHTQFTHIWLQQPSELKACSPSRCSHSFWMGNQEAVAAKGLSHSPRTEDQEEPSGPS